LIFQRFNHFLLRYYFYHLTHISCYIRPDYFDLSSPWGYATLHADGNKFPPCNIALTYGKTMFLLHVPG